MDRSHANNEWQVINWSKSTTIEQQLEAELRAFTEEVRKMNHAKLEAIICLNEAADYLDKLWRNCRIASAIGNSAGIVGGVLTIGGGIATFLTAGAATPLLMAGISIGAAAAGTGLGTAAAEAVVNSKQIRKAEKAMQIADLLKKKVKEQVNEWKQHKDKAHLAFLFQLAVALFGENHIVVKLVQSVLVSLGINAEVILNILAEATVKTASEIAIKAVAGRAVITAVETATGSFFNTASRALQGAAKEGSTGLKASIAGTNTAGKIGSAGSKLASKAAGTVIIGVSAVFVALDAVDLTFKIRDLIKKKGCKAASYLRKKAEHLESSLE